MNFDFDTRQSVQEAFEDAALRRRRREVELKRLQVEDAKLELQRAQLQQSSRARPRGRGTGPPHKYGHVPSGGGRTGSSAKPGTARKQRRGQGSLERRREARAAAREAALAQSAASKEMMSRATLRASLAPTVLLPTAPAFEPASVRQWQDQHSQPTNQRLDASHGNEHAIEHKGSFHPSYTHVSARQDQPADHSRSIEDSTRRFSDHVASQMGSAKWAGWTMICDMLNDSEPANRASAVNTLCVMTNDMGSNHQIHPDVGGVAAYSNNATDIAPSNEMQKLHASIDTAVLRQAKDQQLEAGDNSEPTADWQAWWQQLSEQKRIDAQAQREEACQAVLEHGAVGQLVGLLNSEEHVQTQIAATHVLRNVVTHAARQPETTDPDVEGLIVMRRDDGHLSEQARRRPTPEGDLQRRADAGDEYEQSVEGGPAAGASMGEECVKTIMEEADVVGPIIDLLDSEDAVVRSSALGTVSELAHASEEARQQFFQQPALLPHLLNVVEKARAAASPPENTANMSMSANHDQHDSLNYYSNGQGSATATADISAKRDAGECTDGSSKLRGAATRQGVYLDDAGEPEQTDVWMTDPDGSISHSRAASSGSIDELVEATPSLYGKTKSTTALSDGAQAMGVLKLMLEKEESAKRVRDAIATRPGVIESIVNVATLAPPPSEEAVLVHSGNYSGPLLEAHEARAVRAANDALLGLGGHSREAAATAVVQLLGQRSSSSGSENGPTPNPRPNPEKGETHDYQHAPLSVTHCEITPELKKSYVEGMAEDNRQQAASSCGNNPNDHRFDDDENPYFDELDDFDTDTPGQLSECSNVQGLHLRSADEFNPSRNLQRRQLAAMATLRNLLTTPDPAAEAEEDNIISTGSLRAVRNAGGVDAVVSLLGNQDPCTQASASLTLMAMVKADDERKRCAKRIRCKRRRDYQNLDVPCERCAVEDDDIGAGIRSDSICNASDDDASEQFSNEELDNLHGESSRGTENGTDPPGTSPYNDKESASIVPTEDEPGSLAPNTADAASLRAVIAENEEAIPRLVSVLSRGTEQPAAAVQAAAALATLVEESPEPATTPFEVVDSAEQAAQELSSEDHDAVSRPNEFEGMTDAHWQQQRTQHAQNAQAITSSPEGCRITKTIENPHYEPTTSMQSRATELSGTTLPSASSVTDSYRTRRTSKHVALLKQQLKQAIEADSSVIPAVVELLRDSIDAGSGANAAARHLADTLRAVATSDLVNQMRIRDAGGVRPIMAVLAQARDEQTSAPAVATALNMVETSPIETAGRNDTCDQDIYGNHHFENSRVNSGGLVIGNSENVAETRIEEINVDAARENRDQFAQEVTVAGPASERRTSIDSSSPRPGNLIGEAWLTTEPLLSTNESLESIERDSHAICHQGPPNAPQDGGGLLEASLGKHYCVDDIGVRLRTPRRSEFDYGCNYERLVSHPLGFRLWFATHSIVRSMRERVNAAFQDYNKANILLEMLKREESELLRIMGRQKGDAKGSRSAFMGTNQEQASIDESHLERYYRVQHEIDYVMCLLHNLERECAFHNAVRRYQFKFEGVETEANAKAELHLLESTFKVLAEISRQ